MRPLVTVAVPSFNQGRFLDQALASIFDQDVPVEVFVVDGGSTDNSVDIIKAWAPRLAGWRSHKDSGQAAAINEAIAAGTAPLVTWLNSDDLLLEGGLQRLAAELLPGNSCDVAYGRAWNLNGTRRTPVWVEQFSEQRLALRCIVSQPATLMRRSAWTDVGGLNVTLHMAMDYDLWWRLHRARKVFLMVEAFVAINRLHGETKTRRNRRLHYREAMSIIRQHHGQVPLKWWLMQPYSVLAKSILPFLP